MFEIELVKFFLLFLEELKARKIAFEIFWPLNYEISWTFFSDFVTFSGYSNISWLQLFFDRINKNNVSRILLLIFFGVYWLFWPEMSKNYHQRPLHLSFFFKKKQMIKEFFKNVSRILNKKQLKWLIENVLLVDVLNYVKLFMSTRI